jgi:hypothetical protein
MMDEYGTRLQWTTTGDRRQPSTLDDEGESVGSSRTSPTWCPA